MATASSKKFIRNNAGTLTEEAAVVDTAGSADAGRIPALNNAGILDPSLVNAKNSSAGAGDAGKIAQLDGSGRLSSTMMPVGFGDDTKTLTASEALAAGDLINVWSDSGTAKVRKADATTAGKEAHGFVLSAVSSGASATVYFEGANTACTSLTAGVQFLTTTAGRTSTTAPSGAGNVVQRVGFAVSATEMNLQINAPIVLA
jgi:hypothetical protein